MYVCVFRILYKISYRVYHKSRFIRDLKYIYREYITYERETQRVYDLCAYKSLFICWRFFPHLENSSVSEGIIIRQNKKKKNQRGRERVYTFNGEGSGFMKDREEEIAGASLDAPLFSLNHDRCVAL